MSGDNIKVAIKVRPLIKREKDLRLTAQWRIHQDSIECTNAAYQNCKFSFDHICDEKSSTSDLYSSVARPIVESSVNGINGTIFAYGQTSSGKTHTMLGTSNEPGIMILAVREIFDKMRAISNRSFILRVSYIEIYNERIYDLFNNRNELKIQEHSSGDINVNCVEKLVNSEQHIMELVQLGNKERKVGETNMNVQSSRSHTIFSIIIESQECTDPDSMNEENDGAVQISALNLVDLAGSERADSTGATGSRLKEGSHINKSLLSLSLVINKLSEDPDQLKFINYRDSKLTRILQPSLGGNAMTAIICTITPAVIEETNYTLGFAMRAKKIKNKPIVNEILSDAAISKRLKKQILYLEEQLAMERMRIKQTEQIIVQKKQEVISCHKKINRRRTWCPDYAAPFNLSVCKEETPEDLNNLTEQSKLQSTCKMLNKFGSNNFINTFNDEEFKNGMECTLGQDRLDAIESIDLLIPPSLNSSIRSRKSDGPHDISLVNGIDKDMRIKELERELSSLQNFQKFETLIDSSFIGENFKCFDTNSKEKDDRISELENQVQIIQNEKAELQQTNKQLQLVAIEANKLRDLAECNLTGIEYEFEQYKARSKVREQELIEQIKGGSNTDEMELLQSKIKTLTDKLKNLETEHWNQERSSENLLKAEKDLNAKLKQKNEKQESELNKIKKVSEEFYNKNTELSNELEKLKCTDVKQKPKLEITHLKSEMIDSESGFGPSNGNPVHHSKCTQTNESIQVAAEMCENCADLKVGFDVLCITAANYINKYESVCMQHVEIHPKANILSNESPSNQYETDEPQTKKFITLATINQQLRNQIKMLKRDLSNEQAKFKELSYKNDLLRSQCNLQKLNIGKTMIEFHIIRRFNSQVQDYIVAQDDNIFTLENEVREYKDRYTEALVKIKELEKVNSNLCDVQEHSSDNLEQLKVNYENAQIRIKQLMADCAKLDSLQQDSQDMQLKYDEALKSLDNLEECAEKLVAKEEELSIALKRIEDLSKNTRLMEEQLASDKDLKTEFNNAKKCIEDLSEELRIKIDELSAFKELQVRHDDTLKALQLKQEEILSLQGVEMRYNDSLKQNDELNQCIKTQKQELEHYKELDVRYNDALESIKLKDEELNALKDLDLKYKDALKNIENLKKTCEQLILTKQTNHKDLEQKYNDALSQLQRRDEEISSLKDFQTKYNDTLKRIEETNEICERKILHEKAIYKELETKYNDKLTSMEVLQETSRKSNSIEKELKTYKEFKAKYEAALQELYEIRNKLRASEQHVSDYEELHINYNDALKRIEKLQENIKQLQTNEQKHSNEINALRIQEATYKSERVELVSKYDALSSKSEKDKKNLIEQRKAMNMLLDSAELPNISRSLQSNNSSFGGPETDFSEEINKIKTLVQYIRDIKTLKDELSRSEAKFKQLNEEKLRLEQTYKNIIAEYDMYQKEHANCKPHPKTRQIGFNNRSFDEISEDLSNEKRSPKTKHHDHSLKEINDLRNAVHNDRKSKRHSFHDDTRRVSGFAANLCDVVIQTDPCTATCGCNEMDSKIKDLRRDLLIKEAQINTMKKTGGYEMIRRENDDLKSKLSSLQDEFKREQLARQRMCHTYEKLKREMSLLQKLQPEKRSTAMTATQTDESEKADMHDRDFVAQTDFYILSKKYESAKKNFFALKDAHDNLLKQNENYMNKYDSLLKKHEAEMKKFEVIKKVCNLRANEIDKLKAANQDLKAKNFET